jgi:hypothetical protein
VQIGLVYSSAVRFCLFCHLPRRHVKTVVEEFGEGEMDAAIEVDTGRLYVIIHFSLVSSPSWMTLTHMLTCISHSLLSSNMQDAEEAAGWFQSYDHTSHQHKSFIRPRTGFSYDLLNIR